MSQCVCTGERVQLLIYIYVFGGLCSCIGVYRPCMFCANESLRSKDCGGLTIPG